MQMNYGKNPSQDELRDFVFRWNSLYPIDRVWRLKHRVAFNSLQHQEMTFIDMFYELAEDVLFFQLQNKLREGKYIPGMGNWINKRRQVMTQEQIDDAFENLDISKFNKK